MITGLADKHFVDVKQSVLVGDSEIDQQAAQNAGIGHFICVVNRISFDG